MNFVPVKKQEILNYVTIMRLPREVFTIYQICCYKDIILMINYNLKLY